MPKTRIIAVLDSNLHPWNLADQFEVLPYRINVESRQLFVARQLHPDSIDSKDRLFAVELIEGYEPATPDPMLGDLLDTFDFELENEIPNSIKERFVQATVFEPSCSVELIPELSATEFRSIFKQKQLIGALGVGLILLCLSVWANFFGTNFSSKDESPITRKTDKKSEVGIHGHPTLYLEGFELIRSKDYAAAEAIFIVMSAEGSPYGDIGMGWSWLYRKDYKQAVRCFRKAEKAKLTDLQVWTTLSGLCKSLFRQGHQDEARETANELLALHATTARQYRYRVEVLVLLKDYDSARTAMAKAIELESDYVKYFDRRFCTAHSLPPSAALFDRR